MLYLVKSRSRLHRGRAEIICRPLESPRARAAHQRCLRSIMRPCETVAGQNPCGWLRSCQVDSDDQYINDARSVRGLTLALVFMCMLTVTQMMQVR